MKKILAFLLVVSFMGTVSAKSACHSPKCRKEQILKRQEKLSKKSLKASGLKKAQIEEEILALTHELNVIDRDTNSN